MPNRRSSIVEGMTDPEHDYSLIDDVAAPDQTELAATLGVPVETMRTGAHVVDYALQKLMSRGWHQYVHTAREIAGDIPDPAVKEITTTFRAEYRAGDNLKRGVRAVSRTRRSYVLEEALWQADLASGLLHRDGAVARPCSPWIILPTVPGLCRDPRDKPIQ